MKSQGAGVSAGIPQRTQRLLAVLVAVCALWAAQIYWRSYWRAHPPQTEQVRLRDGEPGADRLVMPVGWATFSAPTPWAEARMLRYRGLLKGRHCDVLLVPMQVEGSAFDRPNRDLMTADLARALRQSSGACISDPYVLDIALGEGRRRRNPQDVRALAATIGARTIVTLYAGHYMPGRMRVTLQFARAPQASASNVFPVAAHSFDDLAYDETRPPFLVFHRDLPKMLAAFGITAVAAAVPPPVVSTADAPSLPTGLLDYVHAAPQNAWDSAYRLMLLGMLAPAPEWPATERLFSKAWTVLEELPGATLERIGAAPEDVRLRRLRARILFHLQERPLALQLLADVPGVEAQGLRALLNGNLPQAQAALAQTHDPWERLFLVFEIHDLEERYYRDSRDTAREAEALLADSEFATLARFRLSDLSSWGYASSATLETLLQHRFPIPPNAALSGRAAVDPDSPEFELRPLRHLYALETQRPGLWCCQSGSDSTASAADLLDLLDSRIEHTLGYQIHFFSYTQGQPEYAQKLLTAYDAELSGSPCFEQERAELAQTLLGTRPRDEGEKLRQQRRDTSRRLLYSDQAQSYDALQAFWALAEKPHDAELTQLTELSNDYPLRPYWQISDHDPAPAERQKFSVADTSPLELLIAAAKGEAQAEYVRQFDHRFVGSREGAQIFIEHLSANQRTEATFRDRIQIDPGNYIYYQELVDLQLKNHRYAEGVETLLSYPPFKDAHPFDPVDLSGRAGSWGHWLAYHGAQKEARRLLQKSVDYRTGSGWQYVAAADLALLDKNWFAAASAELTAALHYSDWDDYGVALKFLFAADQPRWANGLFDAITSQYTAPAVWNSAMVAHRKAGLGTQDLRHWTAERLDRDRRGELYNDILSESLLEALVDRQPEADLADYFKTLGQPMKLVRRNDGDLYALPQYAHSTDDPVWQSSIIGGRSELCSGAGRGVKAGDLVPNPYGIVASAMQAFYDADYAGAVAQFWSLCQNYHIEYGAMHVILPYYAYAASKIGDPHELRKALSASAHDIAQNHEGYLARAILAAQAGDRKDALAWLKMGSEYWPYRQPARALISGYGYLDLCARLYDETHDTIYRDAALRLGRVERLMDPTAAYAHAIVAYLSDDPQEQLDALSLALELDPQSYWVNRAPLKLRNRAMQVHRYGQRFAQQGDWEALVRTLSR